MTPDYDRMSFGELRTYILNNRHDLAALRHLFWVKGRRATPSYSLADSLETEWQHPPKNDETPSVSRG